jgi:dephospho-CoA kinase
LGHSEVWGPAGERLLIVGLTGGIASGKTEVDRELIHLGALVVDADQVARDVVGCGTPTYRRLLNEFGEGILGADGEIDRAALAGMVFGKPEKLQLINGITHPAIFQKMLRLVSEYAEGLGPEKAPVAVLDAALIVDTGVSGVFDMLIVVTADEGLRVKRLVEMREMDEAEARSRIASQVPDARRVEMADIVIENNGSIEELRHGVSEAWEDIVGRARRDYS